MLRARLITAAVALPLLLYIILYPSHLPISLLVTILGIVGISELAVMAFPENREQRIFTSVLGGIFVCACALPEPPWLSISLTTCLILSLLWTLFTGKDMENGLRDLCFTMFSLLYVGFLLPHFVWLHRIEGTGTWLVIFVLVVAMAGDTGGYFAGKSFGNRKLIPRVSPGKTVEGAVGVIAASIVGAIIAKLTFLADFGWPEILILAALMGVLGQLGDLVESVIKRSFGVKDSGWLFPGHGGVLDRIDSLLFQVALVYYYVVFSR